MADFLDSSNEIHSFPSEYDPNTGEDLSLSKPKQMGLDLTPVRVMQAPDGRVIPVKYSDVQEATKLGLKPTEQVEAENAAQKSRNKTASGDIGYTPNKTESFWGNAANAATANTLPQVEGLIGGVKSSLNGGSFGSGFEGSKQAAQAVQTARERTNPITSELGSILGSGTTLAATGGVSNIPSMVAAGAGLGATSELENQINRDQPLSTQSIANAGGIGGAQALIGGIAGKGIQKLGNIANKAGTGFISQPVKEGFTEGLQGGELANPDVNRQVFKTGAVGARNFNDLTSGIKSEIGKTKGDLLNQIGPVDTNSIRDLINEEQQNIYNKYQDTAFSREKDSLNNTYNLFDEAKDTLKADPNNPVALDKVKQILQDVQYSDIKPIKQSRDALQSVHNVRNGIMNYLQDQSEKLGGTNAGYKNIAEAEDADALHSIQFTPQEVTSLGTNNPSASAIAKLDNAQQLNTKLQNNPAISNDIKSRFNDALNNLSEIGRKANLATTVSKGGLPNVANQAGYLLQKTPPIVQGIARTIYGIPEGIFNNLPIEIQKAISISPDLAKKFQTRNNQQSQQ